MNTRPRKTCARAWCARGNRPLCGCASPRWMSIAALSDSTPPSGSTRVGIWPSGLALRSSAKAAFGAHEAVSTMRYAAPTMSSAIWVVAEPEPFLPYRVYMPSPACAGSTVAPAILVRGVTAGLGIDPEQVVVRIEAVVARDPRADHQQARRPVGAVDQMVGVTHPRLEAGAHPRAQQRLAGIGAQHHLAFEHVHELVAQRMPVPKRRLRARLKGFQVDAELGQREDVAEPAPVGVAHARVERLGVACSGFGLDVESDDGCGLGHGLLLGGQVVFSAGAIAAMRRCISSSATSSVWVAMVQIWPKGSLIVALRSP